ncbi:MAG: ComEC/Rec2 family competence protein [Bacteroidetes bacterium]|nr:ComEC/Rec2 family competence protein [Bacteroidota bacterium]
MNYIRNAWEKVPVMRVFIPFLVGILLAFKYPYIPVSLGISCAICTLLLSWIINKIKTTYSYRLRYFQGVFICISVISASYLLTISNKQILFKNHFSKIAGENSILVLKVKETAEEKEKTFKMVCKVIAVEDSGDINPSMGKLLTYIRKDSTAERIKFGDILVCQNKSTLVDEPKNPGQFNFKHYLSNKQIYQQAFLDSSNWNYTGDNKGFKVLSFIYDLRVQIVQLLETNIKGKDGSSIATALLVGYKAELSDELKKSFASTGAMHVLAVSGLHVGIIFIVFNFLFKGLLKKRRWKWLYLVLNLVLLWTYAVITGLSPSVLRACSMFSFVIIGKHWRRLPNIYSSLITSALFILIINPYLVTQVGFQLSYAAVFGIVFFQPRFYSIISMKKLWLTDKIWVLITVSLAAQLTTFPLAIHYFSMFPVYFMLSNLLVIPAASIIIYLGFAYLLFEAFGLSFISKYLVVALDYIIGLLNKGIILIRDLPNGLIEEIQLSSEMMILIYFIIFSLALFIINKQKIYFYISLASILLLVSFFTFWNISNRTNQRVVIYSIPNSTLIGFFDGKSVAFLGDSAILNNYELRRYNTFRDLWRHGCKTENVVDIPIGSSYNSHHLFIDRYFIQFMNEKMILYNGAKKYESPEKVDCNKLLIYGDRYIDFELLSSAFSAENIILDQSLNYRKIRALVSQCEKRKWKYIDLKNSGALVIE